MRNTARLIAAALVATAVTLSPASHAQGGREHPGAENGNGSSASARPQRDPDMHQTI